jgi:taurine dioxygenase
MMPAGRDRHRPTEVTEMDFEIRPVAGALGAELCSLDLCTLTSEQVEGLRRVLHEYEVVFVRGANLSEDKHLALAGQLGTPNIFPISRLLGETTPTFQRISDGPDSPSEADSWHTDVTWVPEPPKYALLCAEVMPPRGGDTMWASMTAAYSELSPAMRSFLEGLTVEHDNTGFIEGLLRKAGSSEGVRDLADALRRAYPPVIHPLVRTHPDTGRNALFLGGGFMRGIQGMSTEESEAVLGFLGRHIDQPRFHCRWRWEPGDVAIWDERSTNHRSVGERLTGPRTIRRMEVEGDRPVFVRPGP